ncbi:50S ribosomal protein L4 [Phycicoccus avicenniae]|uniref:50S ribosomal protein L4, sunset domain variant n=1 Tax=Phycicoccus avicenniae TaxID=2828860 RepID=UPI003D2742BE
MATKTLDVTLPAEIFDVQTNVPLIHQVVVAQLAAARQGTHATKTRGEVRGGGRKPYRQKGTGRARQGSTRAPQFAGGGTVHGPQPRDYAQRTPKKMKAAALRGALSDRARHGRVHVVEAIASGDAPSTKAARELFAGLTERPNLLVVLDRTDIVSMKSVRNLADVHVLAVDQLNTYDVLCADEVVFTQAAYETFTGETVQAAPAKKAAAKKAPAKKAPAKKAAETEVAEAAPAADLPKGAVAALEDGSAPEGYTVKGNADSGKYHEPDGQWYEQTVAEFWFKTAAAAEKAGFTKAGAKADVEDEK